MPSDDQDEDDLTKEQIAQRKQHWREKYGPLFDDALALFFRLDLMELGHGYNTDEYSPEVQAILVRIHEASSAEDLRAEYLKCRPSACSTFAVIHEATRSNQVRFLSPPSGVALTTRARKRV